MLYNSKIYKIVISVGDFFGYSYENSKTRKLIAGNYKHLREIWDNSAVGRFTGIFLKEDESYKTTHSYKVITRPFRTILNKFTELLSDPLSCSIKNSFFMNLAFSHIKNILINPVFYSGLFLLSAGIAFSAMVMLKGGAHIKLYISLAAVFSGLVLVFAGLSEKLNSVFKNSYIISSIVEFWSNAD